MMCGSLSGGFYADCGAAIGFAHASVGKAAAANDDGQAI
jgi:hypothetical protein